MSEPTWSRETRCALQLRETLQPAMNGIPLTTPMEPLRLLKLTSRLREHQNRSTLLVLGEPSTSLLLPRLTGPPKVSSTSGTEDRGRGLKNLTNQSSSPFMSSDEFYTHEKCGKIAKLARIKSCFPKYSCQSFLI